MDANDTNISNQPFESDSEYLDAEFGWIKLYVALMETERLQNLAAPDPVPDKTVGKLESVPGKEIQRRLAEQKKDEKKFRQLVDSRIDVHRKSQTSPLGLDILTAQYDLSEPERQILLILTLPAVTPAVAMDAYAPLGIFSASMQIHDVVSMLRPNGVNDWLQYRRLFQVSEKLIKYGLVTVDFHRQQSAPGDLWFADASLSGRALATITADPSFLDDADCNEPDDDSVH